MKKYLQELLKSGARFYLPNFTCTVYVIDVIVKVDMICIEEMFGPIFDISLWSVDNK